MSRIAVLVALLTSLSPGFARDARVDFDHGTHFSSYKTYRWVESGDTQSPLPAFPNQLMERRVAGFIEEALAARGLKRVTTGGDLLISSGMTVTEHPQYFTSYSGGGPGWGSWGSGWGPGWGPGFATTTVEMFYQGTLIINIVDAKRGKLVFQGTSSQSVSSRPERNTERLGKAVNRVMAKYPPQP